MLVHVQSSTTAITHSENHRCTTTYDVATSEDLTTRRLHIIVYGNRILATKLQALDRLRNQWVGRYTNGHNYLIHIERNGLTLNRYR